MTSTTTKRCPAEGCRTALGTLRNGELLPAVPVRRVDRFGAAELACPRCGTVWIWKPESARRR